MRVSTINQARKLQARLEDLHDRFNAKYGSSNEFTMGIMSAFCLAFSIMCDLEQMGEDGDNEE